MTNPVRRLVPWWVLALLFVALPVTEIYLLIQVGQAIGGLWTVALLLASGIAGAWLVKHEGSRAWRALQEALVARRMPARELADGALILIGG
ncbi:MAG: FxsA family protein, partial [Nocardioides sp.]